MSDTYTIFEKTTGFPVDVVWGLAVTIGMLSRWEASNPDIEFDYRKSTLIEQRNAHIIQQNAAVEFTAPAN